MQPITHLWTAVSFCTLANVYINSNRALLNQYLPIVWACQETQLLYSLVRKCLYKQTYCNDKVAVHKTCTIFILTIKYCCKIKTASCLIYLYWMFGGGITWLQLKFKNDNYMLKLEEIHADILCLSRDPTWLWVLWGTRSSTLTPLKTRRGKASLIRWDTTHSLTLYTFTSMVCVSNSMHHLVCVSRYWRSTWTTFSWVTSWTGRAAGTQFRTGWTSSVEERSRGWL